MPANLHVVLAFHERYAGVNRCSTYSHVFSKIKIDSNIYIPHSFLSEFPAIAVDVLYLSNRPVFIRALFAARLRS